MTYKIGYIVGSLSKESVNRSLAQALIKVAPADLAFEEIPIKDLPLYNRDLDDDYPPPARALKEAIGAVDGVMFVTPEYNRAIPGALKNAIDWASRPYGTNSFDNMPAAVIGGSPGAIGTAMAQQSLRGVLTFCNARQMTAPEAYIQLKPGLITAEGDITDSDTEKFLTEFMRAFRDHTCRVLTVLPRNE
ncbi:NADPH-dependent FMN reductase [Antrihabitans sp. YC2-6]|uniref:NADPH-dependent FMN reductase n=1 Tax=Antrihabitans sp. YC2-6 TaxID=2799498 RepID=UPI0018F30F91|nr:NADPH-dependent FMN reductase [Antrihabitans sp. YC2-6]MBJ8345241.1 NAD(P)H-dependent oxidoreductase [Antrihabitans sp. YC2-6]